MSHSIYRGAIASIAAAEADGQDVEDRISALAASSGVEASMIRHEVTEAAQG